MLPPFDIFKRGANGEVLYIKSAEDFKSARLAIHELMTSSPHEYYIYSHRTNNHLTIKPSLSAKRRAMPLIFQIAYDEVLMASRAELLKAEGFSVISALGNEEAKVALATPQDFSLFVIGHAAVLNVRREMAEWIRLNSPGRRYSPLTHRTNNN